MDAMRTTYDVDMRFPGVGIVRVRWFFTDNPVLDVVHVYGSHNHSREDGWEDYDTGDPGEVWGSVRTRNDGRPPPSSSCGVPTTDENAWLGETDENSPLYLVGTTDVSEFDYGADYSTDYESPFSPR